MKKIAKIEKFLEQNKDMKYIYNNFILKKYSKIEAYYILRYLLNIDENILLANIEESMYLVWIKNEVNTFRDRILCTCLDIREELEIEFIPPWAKTRLFYHHKWMKKRKQH